MKIIKANWIRVFGINGITFGRYVLMTEDAMQNPRIVRHEQCHVNQYKADGFFKFILRYVYFHFTKGYQNNPYEMEARAYEHGIQL